MEYKAVAELDKLTNDKTGFRDKVPSVKLDINLVAD